MNEQVTFGIAVLGAVLGLLGTYRDFRNDRVRISVRPINIIRDGKQIMAVEIVNRATFPITVRFVNFSMRGNQVLWPEWVGLTEADNLTKRMEPRTMVTITFPLGASNKQISLIRKACVLTACGCTISGTSPAMKLWIKDAKLAVAAKELEAQTKQKEG